MSPNRGGSWSPFPVHDGLSPRKVCANRGDRGINLPARCVCEPSICFPNCSDFIRARIKVHRCENCMNKRAEPPPAWTLCANALHRFDLDA